jgi:hypothetical protein
MLNEEKHDSVILEMNDLFTRDKVMGPDDFTTKQYMEEVSCTVDQAYKRLRKMRDAGWLENVSVLDENMQTVKVWRPTKKYFEERDKISK